MNERAKAIVNAPGSPVPQTELTTAQAIRQALNSNINGGNYGVYCCFLGEIHRVYQVRTRKGELQVKVSTGWVKSDRVYVEG